MVLVIDGRDLDAAWIVLYRNRQSPPAMILGLYASAPQPIAAEDLTSETRGIWRPQSCFVLMPRQQRSHHDGLFYPQPTATNILSCLTLIPTTRPSCT